MHPGLSHRRRNPLYLAIRPCLRRHRLLTSTRSMSIRQLPLETSSTTKYHCTGIRGMYFRGADSVHKQSKYCVGAVKPALAGSIPIVWVQLLQVR